ncbi:hypothetical protein ADICEAN_04000 [Cesiribacter andamanensis AMV16]|uniref:Carboxypeptidase regulatory-like domain-containing protein n=2 Tax=Cesiribacter TaxID=1133570 RepID=M7N0Z3_9BACT|nr:hypothetical protein ADICEAN_04000 [Cesiribacter andamanensis AMV16]
MLALLLVAAWGCKKDDEPAVGVVSGVITDAVSNAALANTRIIVFESNANVPVKSLTTGADGAYRTELLPGSYYLRLYRQGYEQVPPKGMSPMPFTVSVGSEVIKPYEMNQSEVLNGGTISGKVLEGGKGVAGVLVVADRENKGYSAVSDAEGNFFIYNLPAGSYGLKGWVAGYSSEEQSVAVISAAETAQNLQLTRGAAGSVTGTITFLATNAVEVDVTLTHPLTQEPVPGLLTSTTAAYTIANVPAGTYLARATYRNDDRVVDPDWIVKNGEPMVLVSSGAVTRNFSLTGAAKVVNPTNLATTTEPIEIGGTTPTFSWQAYPSASDYVVEVSDANGNVIWGGIDRSGVLPAKRMVIASSQTSIQYNADGKATRPLEPGKVYRWRVFVSKNDTSTTGWRLISVSEDQMGLFRIAN